MFQLDPLFPKRVQDDGLNFGFKKMLKLVTRNASWRPIILANRSRTIQKSLLIGGFTYSDSEVSFPISLGSSHEECFQVGTVMGSPEMSNLGSTSEVMNYCSFVYQSYSK